MVSARHMMAFRNEMLSHTYGWTPNEIREMSSDDINSYLAILSGKAEQDSNIGKMDRRTMNG